MDVRVNFEAQSNLVFFFFYTQKKKDRKKNIFLKNLL